jgi:hypothetical protein
MHVCAQGGKVIHILHSYLCSLDFWMEPPFDCVDEDLGGGRLHQGYNFLSGVKVSWRSTW